MSERQRRRSDAKPKPRKPRAPSASTAGPPPAAAGSVGGASDLLSSVEAARAARALEKLKRGDNPSKDEARALTKLERLREERDRRRHYATIPKVHYVELSGRQTKVLHEQAERYQIPIREATIDLGRLLRWLHNFLAENHRKLSDDYGEEEFARGESSDALEAWRREKARIARIERGQKEKSLIDVRIWRESASRLAAALRTIARTAGERFGAGAAELYNEAVRAVESHLAEDDDGDGEKDTKRTADDAAGGLPADAWPVAEGGPRPAPPARRADRQKRDRPGGADPRNPRPT